MSMLFLKLLNVRIHLSIREGWSQKRNHYFSAAYVEQTGDIQNLYTMIIIVFLDVK